MQTPSKTLFWCTECKSIWCENGSEHGNQKARRSRTSIHAGNASQDSFAKETPVTANALLHVRCCLYRSLSVVSAKSANIKAPIQKRVITFDSDQPISSKW